MADPGEFTVSIYFSFEVEGIDFGQFTRMEGFSITNDHEIRQTASQGEFMHVFPGRIRYSNLKLARPLSPLSKKFISWMHSFGNNVGRVGVLKALNPDKSELVSWSLEGVLPISWTGPNYDLSSPEVAMETLEFAYRGILPMGAEVGSGISHANSMISGI
ncbi:MAG: phage tail protein [Actinomycetota bacterium]|nr:phage tail protein [Actinomycetota bacterium]MDA8209604.1 phage tail protein [Actinomycetota bacterium]